MSNCFEFVAQKVVEEVDRVMSSTTDVECRRDWVRYDYLMETDFPNDDFHVQVVPKLDAPDEIYDWCMFFFVSSL